MTAIRCPACGSPFWKKVDINFQCQKCGIVFAREEPDRGPVLNRPTGRIGFVTSKEVTANDLRTYLGLRKSGQEWDEFTLVSIDEVLLPMWRFAFRTAAAPVDGRYVQGEHGLYVPAVSWMLQFEHDQARQLILNHGMPDCIGASADLEAMFDGQIVPLEDAGWRTLEADLTQAEAEPLALEQADAVRTHLRVSRQVPVKWRAELIHFEFGEVKYRFGSETRTAYLPLDTRQGEVGKIRFGEFSCQERSVPMGSGGTRIQVKVFPM